MTGTMNDDAVVSLGGCLFVVAELWFIVFSKAGSSIGADGLLQQPKQRREHMIGV